MTLLEPFEQIKQAFHFKYMPLLCLCSSGLLQLVIDSRNYYFIAAIVITEIAEAQPAAAVRDRKVLTAVLVQVVVIVLIIKHLFLPQIVAGELVRTADRLLSQQVDLYPHFVVGFTIAVAS